MKFILEGAWCRISKPPTVVVELISDYMTLEWDSWFRTKNMKRAKFRREEVTLYDEKLHRFPAGFFFGVIKMLQEKIQQGEKYYRWAAKHAKGVEQIEAQEMLCLLHLELDDRAPQLILHPQDLAKKAPWLLHKDGDRDYTFQFEAVLSALEQSRGIIKVPTGGGKTNCAAAIMSVLNLRWLFVAPSKDLVIQGRQRYEKLTGEAAGQIGDGKWEIKRVTFATFQTLHKRLKTRSPTAVDLIRKTQGLICDESHTLPANTFFPTVMKFNQAHIRLGLSATPLDRADRRSVYAVAALGPVCWTITQRDLVARGVLSKAHVRMVKLEQDPVGAATWRGEYGKNVVRSAKRNQLLADLSQKSTKPVLLFVKQIDHGKQLLKRLRKAGLSCELVWGNKDAQERQAAIRRLEQADIDVLVSSPVFKQGVDIPSVRTVINGAAGASTIDTIQRMGRGSRRAKGKSDFDLWDVFDVDGGVLEGWAMKRLKAYEREGHDVELLLD